mmetsp:Transcript_16680/g.18555  ORF Transcript_16680/g.18555 Transcript_16680/m.18555 type:complete len:633 (+) Transcript_16680:104-2002(+)|eukprot:CAMPEP_0168523048 /NCGR_PEP_ID=MMETSP0405-20121227/9729_1 /TAXON_ID=498012 /ORGANISM="Trichosphaerium sp, Strain Am-I-7 wt" /LENGTH=632 /DNA_ID=CAMNT_0008544803 /DNA_START=52 /DNA_END=1950 /DNA_ORIENTATION=-
MYFSKPLLLCLLLAIAYCSVVQHSLEIPDEIGIQIAHLGADELAVLSSSTSDRWTVRAVRPVKHLHDYQISPVIEGNGVASGLCVSSEFVYVVGKFGILTYKLSTWGLAANSSKHAYSSVTCGGNSLVAVKAETNVIHILDVVSNDVIVTTTVDTLRPISSLASSDEGVYVVGNNKVGEEERPYISMYELNGKHRWTLYDYPIADYLSNTELCDPPLDATSLLHRVVIGKDGHLYVMGEINAQNNVFTLDGTPPSVCKAHSQKVTFGNNWDYWGSQRDQKHRLVYMKFDISKEFPVRTNFSYISPGFKDVERFPPPTKINAQHAAIDVNAKGYATIGAIRGDELTLLMRRDWNSNQEALLLSTDIHGKADVVGAAHTDLFFAILGNYDSIGIRGCFIQMWDNDGFNVKVLSVRPRYKRNGAYSTVQTSPDPGPGPFDSMWLARPLLHLPGFIFMQEYNDLGSTDSTPGNAGSGSCGSFYKNYYAPDTDQDLSGYPDLHCVVVNTTQGENLFYTIYSDCNTQYKIRLRLRNRLPYYPPTPELGLLRTKFNVFYGGGGEDHSYNHGILNFPGTGDSWVNFGLFWDNYPGFHEVSMCPYFTTGLRWMRITFTEPEDNALDLAWFEFVPTSGCVWV